MTGTTTALLPWVCAAPAALVTPAQRPEMLVTLYGGLGILAQRQLPTPAAPLVNVPVPDAELLTIFVAGVLGQAVRAGSVQVVAQVGRFARVGYAPLDNPDPEIVVCLAPGGEALHQALVAFAAARASGATGSPEWYQRGMRAARVLVGPLRQLRAHPLEADFVLRWALYKVATGQRA